MDDIVVGGTDGSTWRYHALHGPDYSPQETGWVLVIENSPQSIDPQALTAADVVGDLHSMQATDPSPEAIVRFHTEQMIKTLESQATELERQGKASNGERKRIAALLGELEALAGTQARLAGKQPGDAR